MFFKDLERQARFSWRGEVWIKQTSSHAQTAEGQRREFVPSHEQILRADFRSEPISLSEPETDN